MAEYQVIARKWRPMRFADVVGQEHLTRTLRNAIIQNRTGHAYLLVGSRGIGKTTTARILAKALNCLHPEDGEPCCKCESCLAIANNSSLDVVEIDAASQNSVNDVRLLREQAQFAPVHSRYKIYIVDEVHMLSAAAWNAFLKILEEPPPHVKFIFATTEVHRVLPTIISRCQRFDLRRIPTNLIVERLAHIVEAENIKISRAALEAIARSADGGMRDAQSLLDQVNTFFAGSENPVDEKQIFALFGLTSPEEMDALLYAMLHDDRTGVIRALYTLASSGRNLETLFEELIEQLRGILISLTVSDAATILETSPEHVNHLIALSKDVVPAKVQILLETLTPIGYGLRNALNKQIFLETAFLKAMRKSFTVKVDDLLAQIQKVRETGELTPLEKIQVSPFQFPATPAVPPPSASSPVTPPPTEVSAPIANEASPEKKTIEIEPLVKLEVAEAPVETKTEALTGQSPENTISEKDDAPPWSEDAAQKQWPFVDTPASSAIPAEEKSVAVEKDDPQVAPEETPIVAPITVEEDPTAEIEIIDPPPSPEDVPEESEIICEIPEWTPATLWSALRTEIRERIQNPILAGAMGEAYVIGIDNEFLKIEFDEEYENRNAPEIIKANQTINNCLKRLTDGKVTELFIHFKKGLIPLEEHDRIVSKNIDLERDRLKERPYIAKALNLFGGNIVDVHG